MWENAEQRKFCELMQQTKENNEWLNKDITGDES
jgi:hypothetical protein